MHNGRAEHKECPTAPLATGAHRLRHISDGQRLRPLRGDGALHEAERLALAWPLQRLDPHAIVAHDDQLTGARLVHRTGARDAAFTIYHDRYVHLDVRYLDPLPGDPHERGQVGGGVEVIGQHAILRGWLDTGVTLDERHGADSLEFAHQLAQALLTVGADL